jgi:YggT family protein
MGILVYYINLAISVLIFLVVARAILTWFPVPPYHPAVRALDSITEPLLRPFKKMGRSAAAGFDLSPMILILILIVVQRILLELARR